jgi:predicted dienelactone hydrolase
MNAPCYTPMFGDQGLAAATVPSFIVAGTADAACPYDRNAADAYAHLGSPDRYLLSVINGAHLLVGEHGDGVYAPIFAQFTVSFFGYYLQGHEDYAQYLTAKYVDSVEAQLKLGLVWGPYTK